MIPDPDDDLVTNLVPEDDDAPSPVETLTEDVASPRAVRKRRASKAALARDGDAFWKAVFADPVGRREMWELLVPHHPFDTRYGVGPNGFPQPEASAAYMAEQQLGLGLFLRWQQRDPEGVRRMLEENDPRFKKP